MAKREYRRPEVVDHGSLAALTADFDLNFVGGAAKLLTMAAVSAPLTGGGTGLRPSGEEVASGSPSPGTLTDIIPGANGGSETLTTQPAGAGTLGDTGTAGTVADTGGSGTGSGGGAGGGGGKLPFTGFAVMMLAALGAAFAGAGAAVRAKLRRSA